MSVYQKPPGSGCRRPKARVCCAFHFVQGCSSQKEAITWQKSRHVTSGERFVNCKSKYDVQSDIIILCVQF